MLELKDALQYAVEVGVDEAVKKYPEIANICGDIKSSISLFDSVLVGNIKPSDILEYDDDIKKTEDAIDVFLQFMELINKLKRS